MLSYMMDTIGDELMSWQTDDVMMRACAEHRG
jgi:hypothetical protein